jgi:iron complex transport system substrate-binding protein
MKRRLWPIVAALMLILTILAGCGTAPGKSGESKPESQAPSAAQSKQTTYPVTLKDGAGRDVTIAAEPRRIVSVAPSNTELVFALGKGKYLVGRSDFCDYPEEAKQIPSIGNFFPPDYEKIVSLKPDLILVIGGSEEARNKLIQDYKLTVFVVDPQNFDQLYATIKTLGVALNAQEQAEKLVATMQQQVDAIAQKAATATNKPKVFYEVWDDPLMTAGAQTFIDDMIRLAGGVNIAADVKGWVPYKAEQVAAQNPDIIIAASPDGAAKIKQRKGWESFKAIKDGKVFSVADPNVVARPGPRLVEGLKFFARTLHPELFQ